MSSFASWLLLGFIALGFSVVTRADSPPEVQLQLPVITTKLVTADGQPVAGAAPQVEIMAQEWGLYSPSNGGWGFKVGWHKTTQYRSWTFGGADGMARTAALKKKF